MNLKTDYCQCGTVPELAANRQFPIEFDGDLNEYNLVSRDKNVSYRLYFCFFCGAKLPESKRGALFAAPNPDEVNEIAKLLVKVTSIQQAFQVLGQPDETVKVPKESSREFGKSGIAYKRHHRYLKRWKTLDLTIGERADGSIACSFIGKYKDESEGQAKNGPGVRKVRS